MENPEPYFDVAIRIVANEVHFAVARFAHDGTIVASRELWSTPCDGQDDRTTLFHLAAAMGGVADILPAALRRGVTGEVYAVMLMDIFRFVIENTRRGEAHPDAGRTVEEAETPALPGR